MTFEDKKSTFQDIDSHSAVYNEFDNVVYMFEGYINSAELSDNVYSFEY